MERMLFGKGLGSGFPTSICDGHAVDGSTGRGALVVVGVGAGVGAGVGPEPSQLQRSSGQNRGMWLQLILHQLSEAALDIERHSPVPAVVVTGADVVVIGAGVGDGVGCWVGAADVDVVLGEGEGLGDPEQLQQLNVMDLYIKDSPWSESTIPLTL
jgi:hypothetical protein